MRVLIVEDLPRDRGILKMYLERKEHLVIEAANGLEALELARQEKPELIISDALMPKMDGFELLRECKQDPELRDIPFIFYSATYTDQREKQLASELGAEAFLIKPMEPDAFFAALQKILNECAGKTSRPSVTTQLEQNTFYQKYAKIVAAKLEEKVADLEQEVTLRRQAEQGAKKAGDEWERTFNAMADIITIQDKDYRINRCNQAVCNLLNKTPEEIIGRRCFELFWGESKPCLGCSLLQTFSDSLPHEVEITKEKLSKNFLVSTMPLAQENGELLQVIHVAKDITKLRKTEEQLRHAQKIESIGTLAGGIAHDFNNILTAILGYAELIKYGMKNTGRSTEDIDQVIFAGKRATDLVRQILTFSRQGEKKLQPLRMQLVVKEALKLLRPSLPSTIEIRQDIAKECSEILADPSQIHQVIMNLCTNAYQAMGEQAGVLEVFLGQVRLDEGDPNLKREMRAGEYLLFTVSDTGCGMDRQTMAKIFDPYFSTKKEKGGTGLGLAMVHGIVIGLGGEISVYSEPGQGTTFRMYLPILLKKVTPQPEKLEKKESLPLGSASLLVVDDEGPIVDLEKRMLEFLGYQVTGVVGSVEALAVFMKRPNDFNVLITDLSMPCMDGMELSRKILDQRPNLPIILVSGFGDSAKRQKAKAIGIREFIMKPVTTQVLAEVVSKVLSNN